MNSSFLFTLSKLESLFSSDEVSVNILTSKKYQDFRVLSEVGGEHIQSIFIQSFEKKFFYLHQMNIYFVEFVHSFVAF